MNFGNFASGLSDALVSAQGGNQAGIAAGNQINTNNLTDAIQLYRQQAQDQLAKQTQQANLGKIAADTSEANARATALNAPPPKGSVTLGPGQNLYGNNGTLLTAGPAAREDPAVAAAARNAASLAAHDTAQQNLFGQQSKQSALAQTAKEYTDAQAGLQQVEAKNPKITSPLTTKLFGGFTGSTGEFQQNESDAKSRLKAAWQAYKDAGGNPPDIPSAGLVSDPYATTPKVKP